MGSSLRRLDSFFFREGSDDWFLLLRVGLGVHVAAYCVSLRTSWSYLFSNGSDRLIGRDISEALATIQAPWIPKLGQIIALGARLNISEQAMLSLVWGTLLAAAICLAVGLWCRSATAVCWLLHLCVTKSGGLVSYGIDTFMTIGLFYLMFAPLPGRWAIDTLFRRSATNRRSYPQLVRRVLQLHLCLIYLSGGLAKALGSGWWDGTNLWRALTRPPFDILSPDIVAQFGAVLPAIGICVVLIELSYPVFIWPAPTRRAWLVAICAIHLAIGFGMGLHLFAFIMIVLNVAAFGPSMVATPPSELGVGDRPVAA